MAPSSGQALVPQAVKTFKHLVSKGAAYLKARLSQGEAVARQLEAIPIPIRSGRQPLHPVAALRQARSQQRQFSTAIRQTISHARVPLQSARPLAGSAIRSAITKSHLAPFSSPLRPNLTGGAFPRSSGGYSLGGKVRHFSSTPVASAHVIQNVSAAVRAFCVNGFKAQYDGVDNAGIKKFRAVTALQEKSSKKMHHSKPFEKGTTLEFRIAPSITAIDGAKSCLASDQVINGLASDFSRSLSTLATVYSDLRKLTDLGSLTVTCPNPYTLAVRFPGCDSAIVQALCNELGIQRGLIREDPEWAEDKEVEMALLFPWAPSETPSDHLFSAHPLPRSAKAMDWLDMVHDPVVALEHSIGEEEYSILQLPMKNGSPATGRSRSYSRSFDFLQESDIESNEEFTSAMHTTLRHVPVDNSDYEGMQGALKFLEECEHRRN